MTPERKKYLNHISGNERRAREALAEARAEIKCAKFNIGLMRKALVGLRHQLEMFIEDYEHADWVLLEEIKCAEDEIQENLDVIHTYKTYIRALKKQLPAITDDYCGYCVERRCRGNGVELERKYCLWRGQRLGESDV